MTAIHLLKPAHLKTSASQNQRISKPAHPKTSASHPKTSASRTSLTCDATKPQQKIQRIWGWKFRGGRCAGKKFFPAHLLRISDVLRIWGWKSGRGRCAGCPKFGQDVLEKFFSSASTPPPISNPRCAGFCFFCLNFRY